MKKVICVLICIAAFLCCNVTVFAADSYLQNSGDTASSTVTYQVNSNYCITIPETIDAFNGFEVRADYMNITDDEQVNVSICGDNLIEMTNEYGDKFDLMLNTIGDGRVAKFLKNQTTSDIISGYPIEMGMYPAGTYTGIVVFVVSLEEKGN